MSVVGARRVLAMGGAARRAVAIGGAARRTVAIGGAARRAVATRTEWVSWTHRLRPWQGGAVALALALGTPALAAAAPPDADRPAGAAELVATTAENGTPGELQAVLEMAETAADAGVPRCLGPASFTRTAWAWIPAADRPRRIVVEATPEARLGGDPVSTTTPDLAIYPQEPVTRATADVTEPAACDGRESLPERGDGSAAVVALLRAGRPALVQVGWREGDAAVPLLVTLAASAFGKRPLPAGDDPGDAPPIALGAATAVTLTGATLGVGDPAQPACPAPATVWRRVAVPAPGAYAVAADGAAQTLTVFRAPTAGAARAAASAAPPAVRAAAAAVPGGDDALACADRADGPAPLGVVARAERAGELWLRLGVDDPLSDAPARLLVTGPYADDAAATAALPPAGQPLDRAPTACIRARAPRLALTAASLRTLRTRGGRTLAGTLRQPCDRRRPQASRVEVAITRVAATKTRKRAAKPHSRPAITHNRAAITHNRAAITHRRAAIMHNRAAITHSRAAKTRKRAATTPRFVRARGVTRWSRTLPRRLAPGRYALKVRAVARGRGRGRVISSLNRTLVVRTTKGNRR